MPGSGTHCQRFSKFAAKICPHFPVSVVAASLSTAWINAVDAVPPTMRPYLPNSTNNTEPSLAFGINGTHRGAEPVESAVTPKAGTG